MKSELRELSCEVELGVGETLALPESLARGVGPGRWLITVQPAGKARKTSRRDHSAFLRSYAPEDEGLYDNAASG